MHEWHLQATREAWHRASLETTYRELSDKDIEFLLAMLPDSGPSRVSEIAKRMGVASNYASLFTYLSSGLVIFPVGIPCAISNIVGNIIGSHFALRKGAKFIRPMMLVVLVLLLGKLITDML